MTTNLSAYPAIWTALFVSIDVQDYQVLRFSNFYRPYTIGGFSYASLGSLMSVGDTTSELRLSDQELTITLSGILSSNINSVLSYKMKGSPVAVYRGLFNANTGADIVSPIGKFKGLVNNFALSEEYNVVEKNSSVSVVLTCSSIVGLLQTKVAGRRTNPTDQKLYYPNDLSMDRVPNLSSANFNFGAPT
jgi:hypothetical protein